MSLTTVTIKTYPNQKPWMDGGIRKKLKARSTAFNHGKRSGDMAEYKQCSYSLHKAIKQAKCWYRDKVELQFNGSDMRRMWQGLQEITDYKKKTSHVTDTDVLLPDKLNTFFEDNTVHHSISVLEVSLQTLVQFQAVSQPTVIGSPIGRRTIGPTSLG